MSKGKHPQEKRQKADMWFLWAVNFLLWHPSVAEVDERFGATEERFFRLRSILDRGQQVKRG